MNVLNIKSAIYPSKTEPLKSIEPLICFLYCTLAQNQCNTGFQNILLDVLTCAIGG